MSLPPIAFASSNKEKFAIAMHVCEKAGLTINQLFLEIDEIQGENPELIVKDKAIRAYEQYGKPVVVSDDSWSIPALNGFPGPYMKSLNYWFKPEDFLRLMNGIEDRSVYIHQYLAYYDGREILIFQNDIPGVILTKQQGENTKSPCMTVVALDSDNGKTIAEVFAQGADAVAERYKNRPDAWHELVKWYKEKYS